VNLNKPGSVEVEKNIKILYFFSQPKEYPADRSEDSVPGAGHMIRRNGSCRRYKQKPPQGIFIRA
jgi:hypothetical protein